MKRTKAPAGLIDNALRRQAMYALASALASRAAVASKLGKSFGGKRDLYEALGYPRTLTYEEYWARYSRGDIAARLIEAPVKGAWRELPKIVEGEADQTEFEKAVDALIKEMRVFHYLKRLDILAGIGQYAVLLIGLSDSADLSQSVQRGQGLELLYLQPYGEGNAEIVKWNEDVTSPRYGLPEMYRLKVRKPGSTDSYDQIDVHHTRVIHVAEGLLESNVYGTPRLQRTYNRLLNLELIVGGSAEMFWQGAFPGKAFLADAETDMTQLSSALTEEIDKYVHGLKRYLKLQGVNIEDLAPQVVDPSNHVDVQLTLISAASGIPKRILLGSERGELASSQDEKHWNDEMDDRRTGFVEPMIVRSFIDRLIELGVLPEPSTGEYTVEWPDLNVPSQKDKAEVGKARTTAIKDYVSAPGASDIIPPRQFLEEILELDPEKVDRIMDAVESGTIESLRQEEEEEGTI